MKNKLQKLLFTSILLVSLSGYSQKDITDPPLISSKNVAISTYHSISDLQGKNKGELIALYTERMRSISSTMPYVGLTFKPNVTFGQLGIPDNAENKKMRDKDSETRVAYITSSTDFQKAILAYADTANLIKAILFYEEILKLIEQNYN